MAVQMQYLVTVTVDGKNLGVFDSYSGGDAVSKSVKHRPGGMGTEKSYVSLPSYTTLTVSRVLERQRDWELERSLIPKAGKVLGAVYVQPLDEDGNVWGSPLVYHCRFLGVKPPKVDSTSDNVAMWELDFDPTVIA